LKEADRYYATLYSAEENFLIDVAELKTPGVAFYVARDGRMLLGFGAIATRGTDESGAAWGELKRMYVAPAARGRRIGRLLLDRLVAHAEAQDLAVLRLETGDKQIEALSLYRSAGFVNRGPFADYPENQSSIFMEMRIA
jgi:putative acetyltransferase